MVFVFATGTMMNASGSNDEFIESITEYKEIAEDFGCARDCVNDALGVVAPGRGHVKDDMLMVIYKYAYVNCYNSKC